MTISIRPGASPAQPPQPEQRSPRATRARAGEGAGRRSGRVRLQASCGFRVGCGLREAVQANLLWSFFAIRRGSRNARRASETVSRQSP